MTGLTVSDIGEFGLIERLARGSALRGIGDDTAILDMPGPDYLLATVDTMVEGTHFRPTVDRTRLGMRALAVNLSDVAAMGGRPRWALISLVVRPETPVNQIDDLYRGLGDEADAYNVEIVGGNVARTEGPMEIAVTLLGIVPKDQVVERGGAHVGDVLMVTGTLGREAAQRAMGADGELGVPDPRIAAGRALAEAGLAHAMMDLSDGLGSDVHHLTAASGVGAVLYRDAIPVAIQAREIATLRNEDPLDFALYGGEDYELLVAVDPARANEAVMAAGEVPLSTVGTVLDAAEGVVSEWSGGRRELLPALGWRHF